MIIVHCSKSTQVISLHKGDAIKSISKIL